MKDMQVNNNPWLALSTYEEKDEYRFKGRDADIDNMLTLLRQNEYVVCYAASGTGKSSLINAGICPKVRREGMFPVRIVFTSEEYAGKNLPFKEDGIHVDFDRLISDKIDQGIAAFRDEFIAGHQSAGDFEVSFEKLDRYGRYSVDSLWWKLRTEYIQISYGEYDYVPLLIFDQFEEVFHAKWKAEFFKWLEELSKDICPASIAGDFSGKAEDIPTQKLFKAIFSLRYEYVGELDYWCSQRTFVPQVMQNRYFLKPLTREQAISVIVEQNIDDEVSARIAEQSDVIVDNILAGSYDTGADDEVSPIVLSLICYVLYEAWNEDSGFSLDSISLGGLIYDYYRGQLNKVGMDDGARGILESVLISSQNARLRVAVSDFRLQEIDIAQYMDETRPNIVASHIVKKVNSGGEDYIEFIHDRLVDAICKKRAEEKKKSRYEDKVKKNMKLVYAVAVVVFTALFCVLTYTSLAPSTPEPAIREDAVPVNVLTLSRDDFDNLNRPDYANATSLRLGRDVNYCRNLVSCYQNVLTVYLGEGRYVVRYAGKAEKLAFAKKAHIDDLRIGENVKTVKIFYPENIGRLTCESNMTRVLIPFGYYEICAGLQAFENVHFEEMSLIRTFWEKLRWEVYAQHTHPFGIEANVPMWVAILFFYLMFIGMTVRYWRKYDRSDRIRLLGLSFSGILLLCIMAIELQWMGIFSRFYAGLAFSVVLLLWGLWALAGYIRKRKLFGKFVQKSQHITRMKQSPISILYRSSAGKQHAIALKRYLVEQGMPDVDIRLDLSIERLGKFYPDVALSNALFSTRCIAIFHKDDLEDTDDNRRYWEIINVSRLIYPVVFGMESLDYLDWKGKIYRELSYMVAKRGGPKAFPALLVPDDDCLPSQGERLIQVLKRKVSPYTKRTLKILLIVFGSYIALWVVTFVALMIFA